MIGEPYHIHFLSQKISLLATFHFVTNNFRFIYLGTSIPFLGSKALRVVNKPYLSMWADVPKETGMQNFPTHTLGEKGKEGRDS